MLHWERSYFNKMVKNLCYEDDVVKQSVFDPPHFPLEMLEVAPPQRELSQEEVILDLAMSVKRVSSSLVSIIRKGWELPAGKRLRGTEVDRELESALQSLSSSNEMIKKRAAPEKKKALSLLIRAKRILSLEDQKGDEGEKEKESEKEKEGEKESEKGNEKEN